MSRLGARLAALEQAAGGGYEARRLLVAVLPHGGTVEEVAEANGFALLDSDVVVVIQKPEGCGGGTIRLYEDCPA